MKNATNDDPIQLLDAMIAETRELLAILGVKDNGTDDSPVTSFEDIDALVAELSF